MIKELLTLATTIFLLNLSGRFPLTLLFLTDIDYPDELNNKVEALFKAIPILIILSYYSTLALKSEAITKYHTITKYHEYRVKKMEFRERFKKEPLQVLTKASSTEAKKYLSIDSWTYTIIKNTLKKLVIFPVIVCLTTFLFAIALFKYEIIKLTPPRKLNA